MPLAGEINGSSTAFFDLRRINLWGFGLLVLVIFIGTVRDWVLEEQIPDEKASGEKADQSRQANKAEPIASGHGYGLPRARMGVLNWTPPVSTRSSGGKTGLVLNSGPEVSTLGGLESAERGVRRQSLFTRLFVTF